MSRAPIEPSLKARPALVNCFLIRASWAAEYGSGLRGWSVTGSSEPSPELGIEPCLTGRPDQPVQIDPDSHGTAIGANWYMRTRRTGPADREDLCLFLDGIAEIDYVSNAILNAKSVFKTSGVGWYSPKRQKRRARHEQPETRRHAPSRRNGAPPPPL
jgi:hypothetical protein